MLINSSINDFYQTSLHGDGDSDRHILTLFSIAVACRGKFFIELGVRNGDTTKPLKEAAKINNGVLFSVDISDAPKDIVKDKHWSFFKQDSISFLEKLEQSNAEVPDLVFIDDWHSYQHVKKELEILDRIVSPKTIILLHDLMYSGTEPYYHSDITLTSGQWAEGGPYRAVAELNQQFWEFSTLPYNNGLTILRKKYSSKYRR